MSMSRRGFLKTSSLAAAAAVTPVRGPWVIHPRRQNTVVLKLQSFANDAVIAVLPEFEAATGLKVEFDPGQSSGMDHLNEIATAYAAGDSPWDVVDDSDESGPTVARAGWLTPVDDIIPQETWDDFPESMKSAFPYWHGFDGAMYRVPHGFECGYFWYRKDILDERGLTPPNTWEEMIELGMEVTDAANGVYATTDALIKGALLHVYTAYLTSQTHGNVFDFDDGTAMALNLIYNMLHTHKIMPETALNTNYDQQNEHYMNDRLVFMRQWPYFQGVAEANTAWYDPEKVAIALPPAGPAGRGSWWGGWGFTVPKYAPNPDGAAELIRFLTSKDIAPKLAQAQGFFVSPRASIMAVLEGTGNAIVDAMSMYAREGVPRPRPFHPRIVEAQTVVDDMASLYLTKQDTLVNVLNTGRELIAALS